MNKKEKEKNKYSFPPPKKIDPENNSKIIETILEKSNDDRFLLDQYSEVIGQAFVKNGLTDSTIRQKAKKALSDGQSGVNEAAGCIFESIENTFSKAHELWDKNNTPYIVEAYNTLYQFFDDLNTPLQQGAYVALLDYASTSTIDADALLSNKQSVADSKIFTNIQNAFKNGKGTVFMQHVTEALTDLEIIYPKEVLVAQLVVNAGRLGVLEYTTPGPELDVQLGHVATRILSAKKEEDDLDNFIKKIDELKNNYNSFERLALASELNDDTDSLEAIINHGMLRKEAFEKSLIYSVYRGHDKIRNTLINTVTDKKKVKEAVRSVIGKNTGPGYFLPKLQYSDRITVASDLIKNNVDNLSLREAKNIMAGITDAVKNGHIINIETKRLIDCVNTLDRAISHPINKYGGPAYQNTIKYAKNKYIKALKNWFRSNMSESALAAFNL